MKTKSKFWIAFGLMLVLFLSITGSCKKPDDDPEPEPLPILSTEISDISATSLIVVGKISSCEGDFDNSAINVGRGICWSNINTDPTMSGDSKFDSTLSGCDFSILLDFLTPGTTYYIRAFASNITGVGYGNVVEVTTEGSSTGELIFNQELVYGSIDDIDGNTYKTIEIGDQTWMAENLKTSKLNDGTEIPLITDQTAWLNSITPGFCYYLNDESKYKDVYGALYNFYTVESGKLCPEGWHMPSMEEWTTLSTYLGGGSIAQEKSKEAGTSHWVLTTPEVNNNSGFTALPGGIRVGFLYEYYPDLDYFLMQGYIGDYWTSDDQISQFGGIDEGVSWYFHNDNSGGNYSHEKSAGLPVRCIKD